ncbi:MAG: helix-turn-helix domain-containing protein, partial [Bacteroidota bacterium]
EAIQQRQMILQFVDKHGSISRSEAASLCRINSTQAYRLLQDLEEEGILVPTMRRGRFVRYVKRGQ